MSQVNLLVLVCVCISALKQLLGHNFFYSEIGIAEKNNNKKKNPSELQFFQAGERADALCII